MQRRMQQRIRQVVEERRMDRALIPHAAEAPFDPEATIEIAPRAIGRATAETI
jgi:hypothetical protein